MTAVFALLHKQTMTAFVEFDAKNLLPGWPGQRGAPDPCKGEVEHVKDGEEVLSQERYSIHSVSPKLLVDMWKLARPAKPAMRLIVTGMEMNHPVVASEQYRLLKLSAWA